MYIQIYVFIDVGGGGGVLVWRRNSKTDVLSILSASLSVLCPHYSKLQREASGINTSLMKLWRCLDQLRRNQQQAAATASSINNEQLVRVVCYAAVRGSMGERGYTR